VGLANSSTPNRSYRPDIDGLRALAILSVVLYHAGLSWLPGGFTGVDIFFVISGYLITGLLVSGRVGAGIGAELGGMRVTEQIDALESLAVDSFRYLVVTRVIACVIALPLLTVLMNAAGLLGGYFAEAAVSGASFTFYINGALSSLAFSDYIPPTLKTMVFGFLIGTTSAYLGYNATGGAEGVGRASTQSVVLSSIFLIGCNVLLVKGIFILFPGSA